MNKICVLVFSVLVQISFAVKYVAVLEIVPADNVTEEITVQESRHLTDELRKQAVMNLSKSDYSVLTRDNLIALLPPDEKEAECLAESCAIDIGRAIGAEYITQGRLGKFGKNFSISVELFESMGGKLLHSIVFESENVEGLLKVIREQAMPLFKEVISFEKIDQNLQNLQKGLEPNINTIVASTDTAIPTANSDGAVPGNSIAEKLSWLKNNAESHNTYVINVSANESIVPHVFEFKDMINVTIIIRGIGENKVLRLKTNGTMFTIKPNTTFVLDSGITIMGHNQNTGSMVNVAGGIFTMNGGVISGNAANYGGGVIVADAGIFTMNGGVISGNTANYGGGVAVENGGTFSARGTITGNVARKNGGGVWIGRQGPRQTNFIKEGGIITGYAGDPSGNAVKNESGTAISNKGHAIFVNSVVSSNQKRKETSAGEKNSLSFSGGKFNGDWE